MKQTVWFLLATFIAFGAGADVFYSSEKVVYFHRDNHAEVQQVDGTRLRSIDLNTPKKVEVHAPQTVRIEIVDPNPVFFKYTKDATTFADNPNFKAGSDFVKEVKSVPGLLGLQAGGVPTNVDEALALIAKLIDSMPDIARQTLDKATVETAKRRVGEWNLNAIETALSNGASAAPEAASTSPTNNQKNLLGGITPDGFTPAPGQTPPPATPPTPPTPPTQPVNPDLQAARDEIAALKSDLATERLRQRNAKLIADAKPQLTVLKQFRDAVLAVDVPLSVAPEAVDIDKDPTVHLNIVRLSAFSDIDTAPRKVGDVPIPLRAYSPVGLGFGPAMVYSFVKAPVFSVAKQTDGTFKIAEKRENRAQNVSAMLTITPRSWSDETFGGGFQLGISPVKDQIGLFTGIQLHIARLVTLGGGYAFQQVPRLEGALTVGGTIASEDEIKTSTHFKSGAYVAMTLSLPMEKK